MPRDFGISIEDKREIIRLIEDGHSALSISKKYCVNRTSAEQWIRTSKACGLDGVLNMWSTHKKYSYETKLAAARAFVEEGLSKAEVMARYGIVSENALKRWIRNYRQGDLEALKPKPKGRPPGAKSKPKPLTYQEELEERIKDLETELAVQKELNALADRKSREERNRTWQQSCWGEDSSCRGC